MQNCNKINAIKKSHLLFLKTTNIKAMSFHCQNECMLPVTSREYVCVLHILVQQNANANEFFTIF